MLRVPAALFYALNPLISATNASDILYASQRLKIAVLEAAAKEFILSVRRVDDMVKVLSDCTDWGV